MDEHYDTGRILAQQVVPVLTDDTPERLAGRVLAKVREELPNPLNPFNLFLWYAQ